jgi:hypothetical protein
MGTKGAFFEKVVIQQYGRPEGGFYLTGIYTLMILLNWPVRRKCKREAYT